MAHDVFISYAVEDKEAAGKVCAALEEQGVKCWMAPRDVPFGADYEEAIVDAISASPLLVLILSPHSNASPHVKREIQNACVEGSRAQIIPFRIGDVPYNKALRYYLGSAQWLDASTPPLEQHLEPLVRHVRARLPRTGEPPPHSPGGAADPPPAAPRPPAVKVAPVIKGTDEGRKSFPLIWVAAGAGALLLVVVAVAFVATRSRDGGNVNPPAAVATPAVNSNVNAQGNGNAQQRTPTPTTTPTPTRTPLRTFPTNLNLKRPLNRNR